MIELIVVRGRFQMLVGSEYEHISKIAHHYTLHSNGTYIFSESDYKLNFHEDYNLFYLSRLEELGFIVRERSMIKISINKWILYFIAKLEAEFKLLGYKLNCQYKEDTRTVYFLDEIGERISAFTINFDPEYDNISDNYINFVHLDTFDFYIYWLDLLNDKQLLDSFYSFLMNEFKSFKYKNRLVFNFFDGIEDQFLMQLYYNSIKNYFKEKGMEEFQIPAHISQAVKVLVKKDDFLQYGITIASIQVVVVKLGRTIEFILFENGELAQNSKVVKEIQELKEKVLEKVNSYAKIALFNKNKIIDNFKKTIQLVSLLFTPINAILLYGISLNIPYLSSLSKNKWIFGTVTLLHIITIVGTVFWVAIPSWRLTRFSWRIKAVKTKKT